MRAGREVRVIVDPGAVDDENAALIAHEIAAAIEKEMDYPGRIKITVVRESRATSYAVLVAAQLARRDAAAPR